ncbi:hypothetical protein V6L77_01995 [Pannonibacter sp. Pt2-lr]
MSVAMQAWQGDAGRVSVFMRREAMWLDQAHAPIPLRQRRSVPGQALTVWLFRLVWEGWLMGLQFHHLTSCPS